MYSLNKKIGEGRYREVFEVNELTCAKKLKDRINKIYFGISVSFPMGPYNLFKFRTRDFNKLELQNFRYLMDELPEDSHKYFAQIKTVEVINNKNVSICELIRNEDGSFPETLKETGKVEDNQFWKSISYVKSLLIEKGIPYFGVHNGNILVQHTDDEIRPVFIDFKRVGMRTFPFQPWVYLPGGKKKKLERLFDRIARHSE